MAAHKAVEHGYRVFILPNPHGIKTPDFILERRGVYKLFDLKNISGKNIVLKRLNESAEQANSGESLNCQSSGDLPCHPDFIRSSKSSTKNKSHLKGDF